MLYTQVLTQTKILTIYEDVYRRLYEIYDYE